LTPDSPTPSGPPKFEASIKRGIHQESGATYKLKPTPRMTLDLTSLAELQLDKEFNSIIPSLTDEQVKQEYDLKQKQNLK